jgi:hypothetical protein
MPYSFDFDVASRLVSARIWGQVGVDESVRASIELVTDGRFAPDFGVVVDALEMDNVPVADEVMDMTGHVARLRRYLHHRVALVAVGDVATAFELGAAIVSPTGPAVQVFSNMDDARAWAADRPD